MSFFIKGTTRPNHARYEPRGSCLDFYWFVLWNLSVRFTILSGRTVKSIGSYHNSIGLYRILDRSDKQSSLWMPTESYNVLRCWSPSWKGPYRFVYHRPTNHRVASWNRPRTDVVWRYCIAAACCIHLALYTMNSIGSVRIVVGSVLNSIERVVLWVLSVCIVYLPGRTLNSFGSCHECPRLVLTKTGHDTNRSSGHPQFIIGSYRHKPILTYGTCCMYRQLGCAKRVMNYWMSNLLKPAFAAQIHSAQSWVPYSHVLRVFHNGISSSHNGISGSHNMTDSAPRGRPSFGISGNETSRQKCVKSSVLSVSLK
jgi:hypothetical protein